VPVSAITTQKITTLNGLPATLSKKIKDAWIAEEVPQCGYCQHGQMMSAAALLAANKNPSDNDITNAMDGNICRCGTYSRIRRAIHRAAKA
jgi:aerobic-type carbon monoxide dehydrogenase small subunit (CoxS/CutS family)